MTVTIYSIPRGPLALMRDVGLPVVAVTFAMVLPFHILVHAFIVLGQAHFVLTYLYQWRGKRMTATYRLVAFILLMVFGLYFAYVGEALPLMVLITVLFSFHFAWDELTLHDEVPTKGKMVSVIGFTSSFFLLSMLFLMPDAVWLSAAAFLAGLSAIGIRFILERTPPLRAERYLWFVQVLLFGVATFFNLPGHVLAVIVILHVLNWYIGYGVRLSSEPARAYKYWREVCISLLIMMTLFFAYRGIGLHELAFWFGLAPYYAWATGHIVLSLLATVRRRS